MARNLKYGSQGDDVRTLQHNLNQNGANLTADGVFGKNTQNAVMKLQKNNGLSADGIVGKNTWKMLSGGDGLQRVNYSGSASGGGSASELPIRKGFEYSSFEYDGYTPSAEVNTAKGNKNSAESAYDTWANGGYSQSEDLTKKGNTKAYWETMYDDYLTTGYQQSLDVKNAGQQKTDAENALANYGDFSYSKSDTFNQIMDKILNREKFSYDVNGDALYQQYKDKYIQQGKMAMQDTMGQAAAMTGGYGNSYAAAVGNQAYQSSLQQLNDVIPELYQMAYDRYNQEGQDLYNQYGMLSDDRSTEYGMWGDGYNRLAADRGYYSDNYNNIYNRDYGRWVDEVNMVGSNRDYHANDYNVSSDREYGQWMDKGNILDNNRTYWGNEYDSAFNRDYGMYSDNRNIAFQDHNTSEGYRYQDNADANSWNQWGTEFQEGVRQYEDTMAFNTASSGMTKNEDGTYTAPAGNSGGGNGGGNSGGNNGGNSGGGTFTNTLWYATGTYDDNGNPVFRNSEGKTQSFGAGINPYTGTKHPDAKNGTFSNGYQPNNIGGTKLKKSGMTTNITGKDQTVWEANGKYWLWRGDLNRYVEVDVSDLD